MKKVLATAAISCMMVVNVCLADNVVSIDKTKNSKIRTETRHYYEFKSDPDPKKSGWSLEKDRVYINEKEDKKQNNKKEK